MSSDFKDVLRERVEDLVRNRLSEVEVALRAAQTEVSESIGRLAGSVAASTVNYAEDPVFDQLSNEIKAQVGQAAAESSRLSGDLALLRDAVIDIDAQQTQADVLNVLVERASNFAPRVILFVIKGQDAIAWAARGFNDETGDESVRGLSVSMQGDTVLGSVLRSNAAFLGVPGDHSDNAVLLDRLGRVDPERICAIPLRVRTKVAALLYADSYDTSVGSISMEALELLVHSAGIIVELASLRQRLGEPTPAPTPTAARPQPAPTGRSAPLVARPSGSLIARPSSPDNYTTATTPALVDAPAPVAKTDAAATPAQSAPAAETPSAEVAEPAAPEASGAAAPVAEPPADSAPEPGAEPAAEEQPADAGPGDYELAIDTTPSEPSDVTFAVPTESEPDAGATLSATPAGFADPEVESTEVAYDVPVAYDAEPEPQADGAFDAGAAAPGLEPETPAASADAAPDESPAADLARTERPGVASAEPPSAASRAAAPQPGELGDDEEKLHNDARRFARLLVSEIKLYYEQRVAEGRANNDLYERLREEIDRSRQMYEKRVNPAVADRFDYFYDELLNTLAQGDSAKLGPSCPGPTV